MDREDFQWKIKSIYWNWNNFRAKGTGASAFVFSPSFGTYGRKELFYHQRGRMQHRNVSESESEFYTWR